MTGTITIPAEWWELLVATLLPAAVALVRARWASSQWGAMLLVALTVLASLAGEIGSTFDLSDAAQRFVIMFIVAVVAHFGLLRPFRVTGSDGVIARVVPGGVGTGSGPKITLTFTATTVTPTSVSTGTIPEPASTDGHDPDDPTNVYG
jgi:hypothetical protein